MTHSKASGAADAAADAGANPRNQPSAADAAYAEASAQVRNPARLAALGRTGLLDSEVEEVFDRLTRLTVRLLGVPAAFLSLVDENRDFYKSACGFGEPLASSRELGGPTFCHYAIRSTEPLVIDDTAADPVYREIPTVRTLGVAAYVGIPLVAQGQVIGSFCAIDVRPRRWTAGEIEFLREMAASAQREVNLRAALRDAEFSAIELGAARDQLREQAQALSRANGELRVTNARLDEANRAKSKFLASMSHELRTPLNAIGGYADLMLLGVHGPLTAAQRDALDRMQRSQRHLLALITNILEYARLETGRVLYRMAAVRLAEVAATVQALIQPLAAGRDIRLTMPGDADATVVHADRDRLAQVLLNLLSNAVKFTAAGGDIDVSWDAAGPERVAIRVRDTGRGIPADRLDAVFEPFVQVDVAHARPAEGVGLGLAISRDLARGMGGELTVQSLLGVGSVFTVTLSRA